MKKSTNTHNSYGRCTHTCGLGRGSHAGITRTLLFRRDPALTKQPPYSHSIPCNMPVRYEYDKRDRSIPPGKHHGNMGTGGDFCRAIEHLIEPQLTFVHDGDCSGTDGIYQSAENFTAAEKTTFKHSEWANKSTTEGGGRRRGGTHTRARASQHKGNLRRRICFRTWSMGDGRREHVGTRRVGSTIEIQQAKQFAANRDRQG